VGVLGGGVLLCLWLLRFWCGGWFVVCWLGFGFLVPPQPFLFANFHPLPARASFCPLPNPFCLKPPLTWTDWPHSRFFFGLKKSLLLYTTQALHHYHPHLPFFLSRFRPQTLRSLRTNVGRLSVAPQVLFFCQDRFIFLPCSPLSRFDSRTAQSKESKMISLQPYSFF